MERTEPIHSAKEDREPVRVAIIGTPRSGNCWLMHLLTRVYDVPGLFPSVPANVDWPRLPAECVLILHWRRFATGLETQLATNAFRVVVLARHPLDVLISALHHTLHYPKEDWLYNEGGTEEPIRGASPCCPAFLDYATGPRGSALLSVSREWWPFLPSRRVRYEDLVADPQGELERLIGALGLAARRPIAEVLAGSDLAGLRHLHPERKHHFWKGRPGLWRSLLPVCEAGKIAEAHAASFRELGYRCDADASLDLRRADANWLQLMRASLVEMDRQREELRTRLGSFEDIGPIALDVARGLRRLSLRYPRLSATVKWLIRSGAYQTTAGPTLESA